MPLALHEEQEKIRIKKQLTNNINHELKTPVAAIQGYLETLLANPCLTAEKRTAFLERAVRRSNGCGTCSPTSRPSRAWTRAGSSSARNPWC